MASIRGMGIMGLFGHSPSNDEWSVLNIDLMDMLQCTYKGSYVLQMLFGKLARETLKGGVTIRQLASPRDGPPPPPGGSGRATETTRDKLGGVGAPTFSRPIPPAKGRGKKKAKPPSGVGGKRSGSGSGTGIDTNRVRLGGGDRARLLTTLKRAMRYGMLFGLVPAAMDPQHPGSIWVPPVNSGRFVARMDAHGVIEVGWQWRQRGLGSDSAAPDRDVWVFVWDDRYPDVGSSAPFDSVLQPLMPELMREQELVETDTQANYELSCPPLVLQENPRADREKTDRQILDLYMPDYLMDPAGLSVGHGPGGTLTGIQRSLMRNDEAGSLRAKHSRQRGDRGFLGDALRVRMDPCTGEMHRSYRTLLWQRGAYTTPAGWLPTAGFPRPALRGDLLAQRAYVTQIVAAAMGVPIMFALGGSDPSSAAYGSWSSRSRRPQTGNPRASAMQQSAACENMRETVWSVRNELSAFYSQAHFHLMWMREAVGISRDVAMGERLIQEDTMSSAAIQRQLELVGSTIREEIEKKHERRLRQTLALHKAAEITKQAQKLWKDELVQQRTRSMFALLEGLNDLSAEQVEAAAQRGEHMKPVDPQVLRDPGDKDGDPTDPPGRSRDWVERGVPSGEPKIDPNQLAATVADRRQLNEQEGRHVAGVTLLPRGDASGQSGYQARTLTEELPDLSKAIRDARDMVEARLRQVQETDRKRSLLTPASGERGETKIELVWLTPPVPDWAMLREMAVDGVLAPTMFQHMVLADLGFDPETAAPKDVKPFERQFKAEEAKWAKANMAKSSSSSSSTSATKRKAPKPTKTSAKKQQPAAKKAKTSSKNRDKKAGS